MEIKNSFLFESSMSKTLSVSSFNLILFTAQQKGADYNLLCQKMGLTADVLQNPDGRLPISRVQKLWKEAVNMRAMNI